MLRKCCTFGSRLVNGHQFVFCAALAKTGQALNDTCLTSDLPFRRSFAEVGSSSSANDEQAGTASSKGETGQNSEEKLAKGHKVCVACLLAKPFSSFSEHPRARDGLRHKCRKCHGQATEHAFAPGGVESTHQCSNCKKYLPYSSFGRYSRGVYGVQSNCRECNKEYLKEYQSRNRMRSATTPFLSHKKCSKCGRYKEAKEFYKNSNVHDGLYPQCKDCFKETCGAIAEYALLNGGIKEKACAVCQEVKELSEFNKSAFNIDGRHSYCRACRKKQYADMQRTTIYSPRPEVLDS